MRYKPERMTVSIHTATRTLPDQQSLQELKWRHAPVESEEILDQPKVLLPATPAIIELVEQHSNTILSIPDLLLKLAH
jgi:hypothetical protein